MASEDECSEEMVVEVLYRDSSGDDTFTVPLADFEAIAPDPETAAAIVDWHYWIDRGYELSI
ncbi:MAG: hypothetical protein HC866_22380 [Leptolyngbyaceae cyanobacterium RU_5_1]|nr:hypothetical protein [Leptolyngbyaceae cyanobacterium RU_5_1]